VPHFEDGTQCKVDDIDLVCLTPWELNRGYAQCVELPAMSWQHWHQPIELTLGDNKPLYVI
jgi:hypothetical protein